MPEEKVGVLAQTTQAEDHFKTISAQIKNRFRDVKIHDTICDATTKRQAAAADLARKVELMLVIGDNLSANTKRLAEICSSTGTRTYQIETAGEIHPDWLKGIEKIGITAGASTPEWAVKEVITCLSSI